MICYVKGKVLDISDGKVILENNGIGYEISLTPAALSRLAANKEGGVYTYFQVKEDGFFLYGFDALGERNLFTKLIKVDSVGPRKAMDILSEISAKDLATAIATSDVKRLTAIKGCGKKTAEKIVLELRDSVRGSDDTPDFLSPVSSVDSDAVIALMSLGFSRTESEKSVVSARASGAKGVEEIISAALKTLAK